MEKHIALKAKIEEAARLLVGSGYVTALVGAGLSVESGIPPFRGPGGLWTRYGEPPLNGFQLFMDNPKEWWERQQQDDQQPSRQEMRRSLEDAKPNSGHYALVDLEQLGVLRHIISQNIDNLHLASGSQNLSEIHGNRTKMRCLDCNLRFPRLGFPMQETPPKCPECGGMVKGDGVMFGEPIPADVLKSCYEESSVSDCMLIIGTSAVVYPAASFPMLIKNRGGTLIEINMYDTDLTQECDVLLRSPSGEVLPLLVERVRELLARN